MVGGSGSDGDQWQVAVAVTAGEARQHGKLPRQRRRPVSTIFIRLIMENVVGHPNQSDHHASGIQGNPCHLHSHARKQHLAGQPPAVSPLKAATMALPWKHLLPSQPLATA
ncbi:hypothetical protein ACLOJK_040450 [Asimina triloba]